MFEAPEQDVLVPSPTASPASRPQLVDRFGRVIEYVRVSVTDRCDLRCFYCLPQGFHDFEEPEQWLTFEEIERAVGAFTRLGVSRIRLTGPDVSPRCRGSTTCRCRPTPPSSRATPATCARQA